VVAPEEAAQWVLRLLELPPEDDLARFAVVHLARRTGDRFRDLAETVREKALAWLTAGGATPRDVLLVRDGGTLEPQEQDRLFGETLPKGLRLQ
jgi:hypothetical protein